MTTAEQDELINIEQDTRIVFSDGRVFHMTDGTTSSQDMWVMTRLDRAGLESIAATHNTPEQLDTLAIKLIEAAYENGTLYEILAGMYVEAGVPWTRENAIANAQYFANLRASQDKTALQGSVASILLMYFVSGLASKTTFLKYSGTPESDASPELSTESPSSAIQQPDSSSPSAPSASVPSDVLDILRAAGSTVVTGTSSPEKSPDTTTNDLNAS